MPYKDNLQKANALKRELDKYRPLTPEMENRNMRKFRLDWNYHSSKIEGNTLTYGETKALILFGHTAQAKPLKDHLEMSGHDEAIKYIEEVIKQKRPLTEILIRELHKLILKEPYKVEAITPDGKSTKKRMLIGQYKTSPNHVKTATGEIFYFATPEETPAKMEVLLQWYNAEINKKDMDIILLATEFHYRFIRIHPFDDGNGRVARLLMNFILMQKAYPPVIIKTEDKANYYNALQQADAGNIEYFFNYICEREIDSLELMLSGARGEEIEDEDDLDKKLQLLKGRLGRKTTEKVQTPRSPDVIKDTILNSVSPLIIALEARLKDFDSFFKSRNVTILFDEKKFAGKDFIQILNKRTHDYLFNDQNKLKGIKAIIFKCTFSGLRSVTKNTSLSGISLVVSFYDFVYEISGSGINKPINKLYHENLNKEDIKQIISLVGNWQYNILEEFINKQFEEKKDDYERSADKT